MEIIILMLVRNEEENIERALNSIILQNEKTEILIIDDASTDKTAEIASNILGRSSLNFKMVINTENQGVVKNAMSAFKSIQDRDCLLMRVDGDDELPEGSLKNLINAYKPNHFVTGSYIEKTNEVETKITPQTIYSALACGVLMHTKDVKKAGGFAKKNVGIFIEYDLYARLIDSACTPIIVDDPVYVYYRHQGSMTTNKATVTDSLNKLEDLWGKKLTSQIRDY